jgi:hypothetical protein
MLKEAFEPKLLCGQYLLISTDQSQLGLMSARSAKLRLIHVADGDFQES